MKRWKTIFAISLVLTIIFMILSGVLNADNTRGIWQIVKALFFVTLTVDIISVVGCIVTSIKNKEKMPIWLIIIIVIVAVIVIMFGLGKMSQNKFEQNAKKYTDNYSLKTPNDMNK